MNAHDIIIQNGIQMFNRDSDSFLELVRAGSDMDLSERQARALITEEMLKHKKEEQDH